MQDTAVPSPFGGYRFIRETVDAQGHPVELFDYFIQDEANENLHQLVMMVDRDEAEEAASTLEELIAHGRWIGARVPER